MDFYGFYTGKEFEAYRFLGAHACEKGTVFRTFAPNAQRISLIGEFNDWQETPMQRYMMVTSGSVMRKMHNKE